VRSVCRYQSTISGSFQVVEIIETFISYMESLERCVCIVYDITAAAGGTLGLKAIRLSEPFVAAYREGRQGTELDQHLWLWPYPAPPGRAVA
jgi:translation initiation factor 3 subunit H